MNPVAIIVVKFIVVIPLFAWSNPMLPNDPGEGPGALSSGNGVAVASDFLSGQVQEFYEAWRQVQVASNNSHLSSTERELKLLEFQQLIVQFEGKATHFKFTGRGSHRGSADYMRRLDDGSVVTSQLRRALKAEEAP